MKSSHLWRNVSHEHSVQNRGELKYGFEAYSKFTVMPVGVFLWKIPVNSYWPRLPADKRKDSMVRCWVRWSIFGIFFARDSWVIHFYALASLCDTSENVMKQMSRSDSKLSKEINLMIRRKTITVLRVFICVLSYLTAKILVIVINGPLLNESFKSPKWIFAIGIPYYRKLTLHEINANR